MDRIEHIFVNDQKVSIESVDLDRDITRKATPITIPTGGSGETKYSLETTTDTEITIHTDEQTDLPDHIDEPVVITIPLEGRSDEIEVDYLTKEETTTTFEPGCPVMFREELFGSHREIEVKVVGRDEGRMWM